jgi:VanZ like family/RDD family
LFCRCQRLEILALFKLLVLSIILWCQFSFVRDIIRDAGIVWSQPSTYVQIFSQLAFLQAVFNFLLLFPLGIYLRYFFQNKYSWLRAFGLSFALSLFYEITQLTAIYGLFNCPYRIFDVDDLILNSTGSLCGFLLALIVLSLFPSQQDLLAKREQMLRRESVPPAAQLVAVAIDMVLIEIIWSLIGRLLLPIDLKWLYTVLGFLIVFFLIPLVWKGKTLGTRIMRFRLIPTETDQSLQISLLTRAIALYLPLEASELLGLLASYQVTPSNMSPRSRQQTSVTSLTLSALRRERGMEQASPLTRSSKKRRICGLLRLTGQG